MPGGRPAKHGVKLDSELTIRVPNDLRDALMRMAGEHCKPLAEFCRAVLQEKAEQYVRNLVDSIPHPRGFSEAMVAYYGLLDFDLVYSRENCLYVTHRYREGELKRCEFGDHDGQSLWCSEPAGKWRLEGSGRALKMDITDTVGGPGDEALVFRGSVKGDLGIPEEYEVTVYADGRPDEVRDLTYEEIALAEERYYLEHRNESGI